MIEFGRLNICVSSFADGYARGLCNSKWKRDGINKVLMLLDFAESFDGCIVVFVCVDVKADI